MFNGYDMARNCRDVCLLSHREMLAFSHTALTFFGSSDSRGMGEIKKLEDTHTYKFNQLRCNQTWPL